MPPNKANILRKCFSQCNAECRWLGQNMDLAAINDGGSDLVDADDTTVYVYDWPTPGVVAQLPIVARATLSSYNHF